MAESRHHIPSSRRTVLPGKVVFRSFRDGLSLVADLKWKHYSMSWRLSLEVGSWTGAQAPAANRHETRADLRRWLRRAALQGAQCFCGKYGPHACH